jgi:hypothetical protein
MHHNIISGLVVQMNTGRAVYLTRSAPHAVVVELTLIGTSPRDDSATLAVTVSGDSQDIEALGLPTETLKVAIFVERSTEVVPGVTIMIPAKPRNRGVTTTAASLVIDADRHAWLIERDGVVERHLAEHGRPIGRPNNR